jgi:transposase
VQNVLRRWRETGQLAAQPPAGGFPAAIRGPVADRVAQWVAEQPDLTLAELCARLGRQPGCRVSISTMCRALQRLERPRKQSRSTPRSTTRRGSRPSVGPGGAGSARWTSGGSSSSMRRGSPRR